MIITSLRKKAMNGCPDKETLEKFIDYGLDEEMNEQIFSHLTTCNHCREKVSLLMAEEQGLLRSLSPTRGVIRNKVIASKGGCLSKAALLAYAGKCLNEEQIKRVEAHLDTCDRCLLETIAIQRRIAATEDMEILGPDLKAEEVKPDRSLKEVLEIILRVSGEIIETIRQNGELLSLRPAFGIIRGVNEHEKRSIDIRKDFKDRDLSVEVKIIAQHSGSSFSLDVSLMKISSEEFLKGIEIELKNESISYRSATDERGLAEFNEIDLGSYELVVERELTVHIAFE